MMSAIVYLTLGVLLARMVTRRPLKVYFLAVALILTGLVGCIASTWASITRPMSWRAGPPGWSGPRSAGSWPGDWRPRHDRETSLRGDPTSVAGLRCVLDRTLRLSG